MRRIAGIAFWIIASFALVAAGAGQALGQKRVALVIGNSAYQNTPKLTNPKNDATDIAAALKRLGFEVVEGFDLDKAAFDRKVRDFAGALEGALVGVFFYAGHGLQVAGQNYLVPIDAQLSTAVALDFEMMRVEVIHRAMERLTRTNVLFLDACRDNPLSRNLARSLGTRSTEIGKGLAPIESGSGTLISFSTHPGAVASDGAGRNSPYAGALVKHLSTSNDDLNAILIAVRNDVMTATREMQVPWEHSALRGRFYFNPASQTAEPPKVAPARLSEAAEAWGAAERTTSIAALEAFIARYKDTFYAELARARIEDLKKQQEASNQSEDRKRTEADAARKRAEDDARAKADAERQRVAMLQKDDRRKLPETLTFTAYDTGSSGFNIAVAVGKALKDKHGSDVRVLPAGNDVARLAPLKANRAQMSAMGIGTYFAQESVFEFAVKDWGPQPLRLVLSVTDCNAISLGVAKDTGVKEVKDLKGKRIGIVVGSPALNQNAYAVLAFGNLTKADVKLVEFSGYGAMWKGMVNNEVDAAIASTISGQVKEVETSARGIVYPATPAADKEGWARVSKIGPYYYPHKTTCGAGIPQGGSVELPVYPYPIFMVYASQPADLVYSLAKAMIVSYDAYKDAAPGAAGLAVDRQNLTWVIPYHEGSVKALKEAGVWKAEHEAHNQRLIKRQDTLAAAWAAYLKTNPSDDKDAFTKGWMAVRKDALAKVGMDPIFE